MAVVGAVYPIDRYRRTPEQVWEALFREPGAATPREEAAPCRPAPEPKRVRVNRKGCEPATPVRASEAMFAWLVEQARSRDPAQPRVLRYRSLLRYRSTGGNEWGGGHRPRCPKQRLPHLLRRASVPVNRIDRTHPGHSPRLPLR